MTQYKTQIAKYLIEILVIIFGIIGAFALDYWNQNRVNKKLELEILNQIKEDLLDIRLDCKNDFIVHSIALNAHVRLDSFIANKIKFRKEMVFDFYWIKEDEYIFPNRTGYESFASLDPNLITDKKLKTSISYVYNHDFPRITKGNNLFPDINDFLSPYYQLNFKTNTDSKLKYDLLLENNYKISYPRERKIGNITDMEYIGFSPIDIGKTVKSDEFKYLLSEAKKYRMYKYRMYKNTIADVDHLISQIEKFVAKS